MTVTVLHPAHDLFDNQPATALSDDDLGNRLVGYAGQLAALTARFLELLAEFDTRSAWSGAGILSCAHWLSWRTGMTLRTAQDHVRVSRALTELPLIQAAFGKGELTYSKVRAITRVATPEREPELLNVATSATAEQVERVVRAIRKVERNKPDPEPPIESSGRWKWNYDGSLSVTLRLSALDGAAFLAGAVRAEYERTRTEGDPDVPQNVAEQACVGPDAPKPHRDLWRHVPSNIAPAVLTMADTARTTIHMPHIAPGAEVIIHSHLACADSTGPVPLPDPHLDNGPALTDAETEEAQCCATVSTAVEKGGIRLRWGRERRYPTRRLVQYITQRDRTCRHPGCGRTRYLHIHHVKPWSRNGETDPDNLILLCSTHHRALHRGAFAITAHGNEKFSFHETDGTLLDPAPPLNANTGWAPDRRIRPNATVPVNGGKLSLAYAIEVLYRTWTYREEHQSRPTAA